MFWYLSLLFFYLVNVTDDINFLLIGTFLTIFFYMDMNQAFNILEDWCLYGEILLFSTVETLASNRSSRVLYLNEWNSNQNEWDTCFKGFTLSMGVPQGVLSAPLGDVIDAFIGSIWRRYYLESKHVLYPYWPDSKIIAVKHLSCFFFYNHVPLFIIGG